MIFDSHAHYDDEQFDSDRDSLLEEINLSGIKRIVNVASDIESSYKCIHLSEKYDGFMPQLVFIPNLPIG